MYRLIIVDDEPKIAEGTSQLFPWENIGFSVVGTFTSAKAALAYMEREPVDVVLSDIQMPDISGLELCRRLGEKENVHVVLFSSYQNYEYFRSALQNGAMDYLLKPLTYTSLTECFTKIKEKLDEQRSEENRLPQSFYDQLLEQVDAYLRDHLQDATLVRCAKRVSLSPTYLSRIYKEKSGVAFSDRLLQLRMERARELLADEQHKAYDVAWDVGYDVPQNFSRAFKNYFGVTPSEYRQKMKGEQP